MAETYPVPHATAQNIILGLEKQVLWWHGTPERTVRQWDFKYSFINTWAKEHGMEWIYHIPYVVVLPQFAAKNHAVTLSLVPPPLWAWGGESEGKRKNSWVGMRTVNQNVKGRRKQQSTILIKSVYNVIWVAVWVSLASFLWKLTLPQLNPGPPIMHQPLGRSNDTMDC